MSLSITAAIYTTKTRNKSLYTTNKTKKKTPTLCIISDFRRVANELFAFLVYFTALLGG